MSAASAYVASGPLPSATYAGWDSQTKQEPLWVAAGEGQNAAGPADAIQFSDGAGNFQGTANATVDSTGVLTLAGDAIVGLNLNVAGSATIGTDIIVGGDVNATGNLSGGFLTLSGNAVVAGNVGATNVTASGAVSGASVAATGAVTGASMTASGAVAGASVTASGALSGASLAVTGVGTIATVSSGFSFGSSAAPQVLSTTGTFQFTNAGNKGRFQISATATGGSIFTIKGNPNVPGQVPVTTFLDQPPGALIVTPSFDTPTGCWTITINIGVIWVSGAVNFYVVYS